MADKILSMSARRIAIFAGNFALLAATICAAAAADSSAWDGGPRAAMRLLAGAPVNGTAAGTLLAGIEIRLGPGWKTYWRYPGDSGEPPRFRFDRSDNVASAEVLFPAPHGFADEGGETIGYKDGVILPVRVTPRVAGKPVVLRVDVDYAVCEKYCMPVGAKAELTLPGDGSETGALAKSEARVPKPVALGEGDKLSIRAIRREDGGAKPRIFVDVAAPADARLELFAEGPTPDWSLPVPAPVAGAPAGLRRFAFELDGLPPGASAHGAVLRLTAVTENAAIEVETRLD
jgi:DsbC/DsbD-like thiol-disulfide interchange protein